MTVTTVGKFIAYIIGLGVTQFTQINNLNCNNQLCSHTALFSGHLFKRCIYQETTPWDLWMIVLITLKQLDKYSVMSKAKQKSSIWTIHYLCIYWQIYITNIQHLSPSPYHTMFPSQLPHWGSKNPLTLRGSHKDYLKR